MSLNVKQSSILRYTKAVSNDKASKCYQGEICVYQRVLFLSGGNFCSSGGKTCNQGEKCSSRGEVFHLSIGKSYLWVKLLNSQGEKFSVTDENELELYGAPYNWCFKIRNKNLTKRKFFVLLMGEKFHLGEKFYLSG